MYHKLPSEFGDHGRNKSLGRPQLPLGGREERRQIIVDEVIRPDRHREECSSKKLCRRGITDARDYVFSGIRKVIYLCIQVYPATLQSKEVNFCVDY